MHYYDGSAVLMGHSTYINRERVMGSSESVISASRRYNTKYHGGVFLLRENDTISVRVSYSKVYYMGTDHSFFGAYKLGSAGLSGMHLSVCLIVCLSVCLSVSVSACLSVCLPDCLFICLSFCLPACLSVCLSVCLYLCLIVCLSVCLFVCPSACLSTHNSVYLFIHCIIYRFGWKKTHLLFSKLI